MKNKKTLDRKQLRKSIAGYLWHNVRKWKHEEKEFDYAFQKGYTIGFEHAMKAIANHTKHYE